MNEIKKQACNDCLFNVQIEHEALELAINILANFNYLCVREFEEEADCLGNNKRCKDCWRDYLMKKAQEKVKEKTK